jgi:hypothetical protein
MKYLNILLCVLMVLFAAVQYNDPDGLFWAVLYLIPAVWAGLAAFRLDTISTNVPTALLLGSVVAGAIGVVYFWPTAPGFWRMEVWWETETAREGIGVAIAVMVLIVALATVWWQRGKAT